MKITKRQLKNLIQEELARHTLQEDASDDTFEMVDAILEVMDPKKAFENLVQAMERSMAHELLGYIMQQYEINEHTGEQIPSGDAPELVKIDQQLILLYHILRTLNY